MGQLTATGGWLALLALAMVMATTAWARPQTPDDFAPLDRVEEMQMERELLAAIKAKNWERIRMVVPRVRNLNEALDAGLLTESAQANRNDIIYYLLDDRDVDPNWRTAGGDQKTALMHAAEGSNSQGLEKLLEAGAEPELMDSGNWTALHYAAKAGDPAMVRRLVSFIDARIATTDGNTPLHYAAQYRHPEAIDVLCLASDPKPNPNAENVLQQTPLRLGCCDNADVLAALLERCGADPNRVDYLERTPLHYAASAGEIAATELLLKAGGNPTIADSMGETPRQLAKRNNHGEVAKVLRQAERQFNERMKLTSTTSTQSTSTTVSPRTSDYEDNGVDAEEEEEEEPPPAVPVPPQTDNDRRRRPPPSQPPTSSPAPTTNQQPSQPAKKSKKEDKNLQSWIQYFVPFFFG